MTLPERVGGVVAAEVASGWSPGGVQPAAMRQEHSQAGDDRRISWNRVLSDGRAHEEHAARVFRARVVPGLHRLVEGALRIEKLDEGRFSAPIGVIRDRAHVARLRQHVGFDHPERGVSRGVLRGGEINVAGDRPVRAGARACRPAAPPLARACHVALIPIEQRQRRAEEEAERVAAAGETLLPPVLAADA